MILFLKNQSPTQRLNVLNRTRIKLFTKGLNDHPDLHSDEKIPSNKTGFKQENSFNIKEVCVLPSSWSKSLFTISSLEG